MFVNKFALVTHIIRIGVLTSVNDPEARMRDELLLLITARVDTKLLARAVSHRLDRL